MSIITLLILVILFALPLTGTIAYVVWRNPEIRSHSRFSKAVGTFVVGLLLTATCAVATVWVSYRAVAGGELLGIAHLLRLSDYLAVGMLVGFCVTLGSCVYILRLPNRPGRFDRL